MLDKNSPLRTYIPLEQIELLDQGFLLLKKANEDRDHKFQDYSYTVFPFAKAYEGFLKIIFLQAGYITRADYLSKYFRIGKVMSPNLRKRLGRKSVYERICQSVGCDVSEMIWNAWKRGRNQVFHYFPENVQSITLQEAEDTANAIVSTMETVVDNIHMADVKKKLAHLSMGEVKQLRSDKQILEQTLAQ